VPEEAIRLAGTTAVNCVGLLYAVVRPIMVLELVIHSTIDPGAKFVPVTTS
jgi:hypothetical protein